MTLGDKGILNINCHIGPEILDDITKQCIREYQLYLAGVDRGNQIRETGAGFYRKAYFKKWYKKSFFAICNFMQLNSYIAWNLAIDNGHKSTKRPLYKFEFNTVLAEEMLPFTEEDSSNAYISD